jgi:hypothetical protein
VDFHKSSQPYCLVNALIRKRFKIAPSSVLILLGLAGIVPHLVVGVNLSKIEE